MAEPKEKPQNDPFGIQRGVYGTNYLATTLFIAGRLVTGPVQYMILRSLPLQHFFNFPPPPTGGFINVLGFREPRLHFLTILMPTAFALKHALWMTTYCREPFTVPFAIAGVLMDLVYESISTLVFTGASSNPLWTERGFYIGTGLYFTGLAIELLAELQRAAFKAKPENEGKLCTTGFWGITRHINYTANVIFGIAYGLALGGPGYAVATAGMYISNFVTNAIPGHEKYCKEKYGEQWKKYAKDVPYRLIPGIY